MLQARFGLVFVSQAWMGDKRFFVTRNESNIFQRKFSLLVSHKPKSGRYFPLLELVYGSFRRPVFITHLS